MLFIGQILNGEDSFNLNPVKIDLKSGDGSVTINDADGSSQKVIRVANLQPSLYCSLIFNPNIPYNDELMLRFDFRTKSDKPRKVGYLGVNVSTNTKKTFFLSLDNSTEWKAEKILFTQLKPVNGKPFTSGDLITEIVIYSRAAGDDNESKNSMTLEIANLVIRKAALPPTVSKDKPFSENFNQLNSLDNLGFLGTRGNEKIELISREAGNQALCVTNIVPGLYCNLVLQSTIRYQPGLAVSFLHRERGNNGRNLLYLGLNVKADDGSLYYFNLPIGKDWTKSSFRIDDMVPASGKALSSNMTITEITFYIRTAGDSEAEKNLMALELDDLVIELKAPRIPVSGITPPFFNWSDANIVTLEYSLDPLFVEGKTFSAVCDRNFFTPPSTLEPGIWYYRLKKSDGSYTDRKQVEIPSSASRFILPPLNVTAITSRPRPWLIAKPKLSDAEKEKTRERIAEIQKHPIADSPPTYQEVANQYSSWIVWMEKVQNQLVLPTGKNLQELAELYIALNRDQEVEKALKSSLMKIVSWNPKGGSSMEAGDIGAYHILRGLNYAYDALHDQLSVAERVKIRQIILTRGRDFAKKYLPFPSNTNMEYNNHAWLCVFGFGESGFAMLGEESEAEIWADFSKQLFSGIFLAAQGYDGDNNEGIGYWVYGVNFIKEYADMLKMVSGIDLYQHPWLKKTVRFPIYTAPHNSFGVAFANTGNPNHAVHGPLRWGKTPQLIQSLAQNTHDPYALWYGLATEPMGQLTPRIPVDIPQSIHYRNIGWAIINTELADGLRNVMVATRSGKFFGGHQQEDQNSFIINAYGQKLAIDSGYYDYYGSPHFNEYSTKTVAHNSLLVNGLNQDSRKVDAECKITRFFDSVSTGYCVGDGSSPAMYNGLLKQWFRRIGFIKPNFVIVHDLVQAAASPVELTWLFHSAHPITILDHSFQLTTENEAFGISVKPTSLKSKFILPRELKLNVNEGYPVQPTDRNNHVLKNIVKEWTLRATVEGFANGNIFNLLAIEPSGVAPAESSEIAVSNGVGLAIKIPGTEYTVMSRNLGSSEQMSSSGLLCDGEFIWISSSTSGLISMSAIQTTRIVYQGLEIFSSPIPIDFSLTQNIDGTIFEAQADKNITIMAADFHQGKWMKHQLDISTDSPVVILRGDKKKLLSGAIAPLTINDHSFEGYAIRESATRLNYHWGTLELHESANYRIALDAFQGEGVPHLIIDGILRELRKSGDNFETEATLAKGAHFLIVNGYGTIKQIRCSISQP